MKNTSENLEQAAVQHQCRALRLPAVTDQCAPLADVASKQRQTYVRYLEALLAAELEERERNTIARRIKDARLPRMKTLEEFDSARRRRSRPPRSTNWPRAATSNVPNRSSSSAIAGRARRTC